MARRRNTSHSSKSGKGHWLFSALWRIVLVISAAALIFSYLSTYVNPSDFSIPLFFGLFFIPLLLLNIFLLIVSLCKRSSSVWIPIIAILPSFIYAENFARYSGNVEQTIAGERLKVESYNVGMFSASAHAYPRNDCRRLVMNHLKQSNADVVALQECFVPSLRMADTLLKKKYPYRAYHLFKMKSGQRFGNLILSKYPVVSQDKQVFEGSTNLCVLADISFKGDTIRICNNHLESYNLSFTALVKKLSGGFGNYDIGLADEIMDVHSRMKGTNIKRSKQVDRIISGIESSPYPVIVCGDFNDTPISYTYYRFTKRWKDTFKMAGSGFAGTFRYLWPLLRIDYVLVPEGYECLSHQSPKLSYADHFPVITELVIQ